MLSGPSGAASAALVLSSVLWATAGSAAARPRPCWDCDLPYEWKDGDAPPSIQSPFPQGFVLTVPVSPGRTSTTVAPMTITRYAEVAAALGRCWSPILAADDAQWHDLTLRVSFRRDGRVNGVPRVVHVSSPADAAAADRARTSLISALDHCTPLPLSLSLGQAIAGQIFAIRFTQQRTS